MEELKKLCVAAFNQKISEGSKKNLLRRLRFELIEIEVQNKSEYFLDFVRKGIKKENVRNLMVPWLLGICDSFDESKDSAHKFGDFPDIDNDLHPDIQPYIKDVWCPQQFGQDYVCNIGNYGTYGLKSSFLDSARIHGCDHKEIAFVTKQLQMKDEDGVAIDYDKALELYPDFKRYTEKYPDVTENALKIMNRYKSMGRHAGGLIISNTKLNEFVPLVKASKDTTMASAWGEGLSGQDLSPVGLIKIDFLGLKTLQELADASRLVKERHNLVGICANSKNPDWDWGDISYLNDPKALEMANEGDLRGIFQFDSDGIRALCKKGGMKVFDDIPAVSSLFRPGPMDTGMHETYINRKLGKEQYTIHPLLTDVLSTTYGVMIFQEQVMQVLNIVGDIPIRDCYQVIKLISKKKIEGFAAYQEQFIRVGQTKLGVDEKYMIDFFNQIKSFAGYGFNKTLTEDTVINSASGPKKIKEFVVGDKVFSVNENGEQIQTEVTAIHDHGVMDVYEVTFDDGYSCKCTLDHKFLTNFGQVPLWKIYLNNMSVLCSPIGEQMLSFLGNTKKEKQKTPQFQKCSTSKRNVERGMFEEGNHNLNSNQHVMFPQLQRSHASRMDNLSGHHAPISDTRSLLPRKVLRIAPVGKQQCYDLEVACVTHNFILPNGIVTSNSHAYAYSYTSSRQLYLKAHYPIEFYTSALMHQNDEEKKHIYVVDAMKHGIRVMPLTLNISKVNYSIHENKIYIGYENLKGIGLEKAKKIVENGPYKDFHDFLIKFGTEMGVIKALLGVRLFTEKPAEELYKDYLIFAEIEKKKKDKEKRDKDSEQKKIEELKAILPESIHSKIQINFDWLELLVGKLSDENDIKVCRKIQKSIKMANNRKLKAKSYQEIYDEVYNSVELDQKFLDDIKDEFEAQIKFYGFSFTNRVSKYFDPKKYFDFIEYDSRITDGNGFAPVLVEIKQIEERVGKNDVLFYDLTVVDAIGISNKVRMWHNDYNKFKGILKEGNCVNMQLTPPKNDYKTYSFRSYDWKERQSMQNSSDDSRLILVKEKNDN